MLAIFGGTDITIERRAWAVATMDAFVRWSVSSELAARNEQLRTGFDTEQWQRTVGPYVSRMLATGEYPMIARYASDATDC